MLSSKSKPKVVLAMHADLVPRFFGAAEWARLDAQAQVLSRQAFADFIAP